MAGRVLPAAIANRTDRLRQIHLAVIERPANDHAAHAKRFKGQQGQQIFRAANPSRGDHRHGAGVRHQTQGIQVGTGQGAIGGNVRADDRGDPHLAESLRQISCLHFALVDPAAGGNLAVIGIDSHDDSAGMGLSKGDDKIRLLDCNSSENHPFESAFEQGFGALVAADATTELHGDRQGLGDCPDAAVIHGVACSGTVEINEMQPLGPLLLPAQGLSHRIITESGHGLVVPLVEADAGALQQVDGRNDLHERVC